VDSKQYTGLGQYLQEIDPQYRSIIWQLKGILIIRRVHFFRTITKIVDENTGLWSQMASLIDCKSEDDYNQLCNLLIKYEDEKVQHWAEHKKQPVIKAGLNKHCSNIPLHIYDSIRSHTNSVEQPHHELNASGKRLTLTEAIQNSAKLDKQDVIQYINQTDFNIHHSYQTANMETNYLRQMAQEESRKRRHSSSTHISSHSPQRSQSQPRPSESNRSSSSRGRYSSLRATQSFEQQRQVLELKQLELRLKREEEEIRALQLKNEEKELELIERRARIQQNNINN